MFQTTTLDSLEQNIVRRRKMVEFNGGTETSGPQTEAIPLVPTPRAPLDDDGDAVREQLLRKGPLQVLQLVATGFVVEVERECLQPIVRAKANGAELAFEASREGCLAGSGKTADDDEPGVGAHG